MSEGNRQPDGSLVAASMAERNTAEPSGAGFNVQLRPVRIAEMGPEPSVVSRGVLHESVVKLILYTPAHAAMVSAISWPHP